MNRKKTTIVALGAALALGLGATATQAATISGDGTGTATANPAGNFVRVVGPPTTSDGTRDAKLKIGSDLLPSTLAVGSEQTLAFDVRVIEEVGKEVGMIEELLGSDNAGNVNGFNLNSFNPSGPGTGWTRVTMDTSIGDDGNGDFSPSELLIKLEQLFADEGAEFTVDVDNISFTDGSGNELLVGGPLTFEDDTVGSEPNNLSLTGANDGETFTVVPEPASLALLGLGGLAMLGGRRRHTA